MNRIVKKLRRILVKLVGLLSGINSKTYWDHRFSSNWELQQGRTQSTLFASGFALTKLAKNIQPNSVLDFGCGLGDSIPVLRMAYPNANLGFYDFSTVAMQKASNSFGELAKPFYPNKSTQYELVYSSNVIEHITDEHLSGFLHELIGSSSKYVVIQAPFQEYLSDGSRISASNKSHESEHERTVDLDLIITLEEMFPRFKWSYEIKKIPVAWDKGDQLFVFGEINN